MQVRGPIMKTWGIQDTNEEQLIEDQGKRQKFQGMSKNSFQIALKTHFYIVINHKLHPLCAMIILTNSVTLSRSPYDPPAFILKRFHN